MFVIGTKPQLVTTAVSKLACPTVTESQALLTPMQGAAITGPPSSSVASPSDGDISQQENNKLTNAMKCLWNLTESNLEFLIWNSLVVPEPGHSLAAKPVEIRLILNGYRTLRTFLRLRGCVIFGWELTD